MKAPLDVKVEQATGAARVVVAGEVDLATADRLREALRGELESGRRVLVDLADCTFIDSVGLSVLVEAARNGDRAGTTAIAILSPSAPVRRLLELTQLESLIPIFDSDADLTNGFAPGEAPT